MYVYQHAFKTCKKCRKLTRHITGRNSAQVHFTFLFLKQRTSCDKFTMHLQSHCFSHYTFWVFSKLPNENITVVCHKGLKLVLNFTLPFCKYNSCVRATVFASEVNKAYCNCSVALKLPSPSTLLNFSSLYYCFLGVSPVALKQKISFLLLLLFLSLASEKKMPSDSFQKHFVLETNVFPFDTEKNILQNFGGG